MWRKHWQMISIYSVSHFIVDFACAFLVFRSISLSKDWHLCILLYNFCAFAMQMPIGIVADRINRNFLFAAIGCILVGFGYGLFSVPVVATIVIGLGNGMFHIGGGVDVLNISIDKSAALGLFVSPGAFGVYFGTVLGKGDIQIALPIVLILMTAACMIVISRKVWAGCYTDNAEFSLEPLPEPAKNPDSQSSPFMSRQSNQVTSGASPQEPPGKSPLSTRPPNTSLSIDNAGSIRAESAFLPYAAACLFLVVCLRSYVGLAIAFPWKSTGLWSLALVCASAFGKTAGGFLSDLLKPMKTALFSLGIAALLFLLPQFPATGVPAILLFNMTMPITLWAMMKILPNAKGFSFGLLTFALFLGFLPVYLGFGAILYWMAAVFAAISLALLLLGLRKARL